VARRKNPLLCQLQLPWKLLLQHRWLLLPKPLLPPPKPHLLLPTPLLTLPRLLLTLPPLLQPPLPQPSNSLQALAG